MRVEVFTWGICVGILVKIPDGIAYQYDPEFKKTGLELSPVSLPLLRNQIHTNKNQKTSQDFYPIQNIISCNYGIEYGN